MKGAQTDYSNHSPMLHQKNPSDSPTQTALEALSVAPEMSFNSGTGTISANTTQTRLNQKLERSANNRLAQQQPVTSLAENNAVSSANMPAQTLDMSHKRKRSS